jgi:hypothetical protein
MTNKKMRLPKDGYRGPDQDGARGPDQDGYRGPDQDGVSGRLIDTNDVEGHGLPLTPPPSFGSKSPGHGGENIPSPADDDDVEGHAR